MTIVHLNEYIAGVPQTYRGIKFINVITNLFPEAKFASRQQWVTY